MCVVRCGLVASSPIEEEEPSVALESILERSVDEAEAEAEGKAEELCGPQPRCIKITEELKKKILPKPSKISKFYKKSILHIHNKERKKVKAGLKPLEWSDTLARLAQVASDECRLVNERFVHIHEELPEHREYQFGQNIVWNLFYSKEKKKKMKARGQKPKGIYYLVNQWIEGEVKKEKELFNKDPEGCEREEHGMKSCRHYTQIVWKDTKKVGCGITLCGHRVGSTPVKGHLSDTFVNCDVQECREDYPREQLLFCNYDPPGHNGSPPF